MIKKINFFFNPVTHTFKFFKIYLQTLSEAGFRCFGTDLVGHGLSDTIEGHKAYIPDFVSCRQGSFGLETLAF